MPNKNVYNVSNPMNIMDALWGMIKPYEHDFSKILIFLPSRRAIRKFERMIVDKIGHAVILPSLVPLGSGVAGEEDNEDVLSNQERVISLAGILAKNSLIKSVSSALKMSHDFIRIQDYLENECKKIEDINWDEVFGEKDYGGFSSGKKELLKILNNFIKDQKIKTNTQKRNEEILAWKNRLNNYELVIVCGSTASVPVTADLMTEIAKSENGRIILSGKISGNSEDLTLDTNPYYAEYKFLQNLGLSLDDIQTIDVGENKYIDSFNIAFSNTGEKTKEKIDNFTLIECNRESQEAAVAVQIAKKALDENKSVLIITPDAAANQRIKMETDKCGINADFSSGIPGNMTQLGRSLLNLFDDWINDINSHFDELFRKAEFNLYNMLIEFIDSNEGYKFRPGFDAEDEENIPLWQNIESMSKNLQNICKILFDNGISFNIYDIRAFLADAISSVSIRPCYVKDCNLSVLGTIESRMQAADVIILTGLNEGMFPSVGYENSWLPLSIAKEIGLPSPNKKVSLMALDFINLSCANKVYWLRTMQSGGALNLESRFISRVRVANGDIKADDTFIKEIDEKDEKIEYKPLDYSAPIPKEPDTTPVFATELEYLINNPYAFYVKHILRLNPKDEYWALPDQRLFGTIVHDAIENSKDMNADSLVKTMEEMAAEVREKHPLIFSFWQARFKEIAKFVSKNATDIISTTKETIGSVEIEGRILKAKADVVWDGGVLDIKTGEAPSDNDLLSGQAPQVPIEGYIMMKDGFKVKMTDKTNPPVLKFLQLKKKKEKVITFEGDIAREMILNTFNVVKDLFIKYSQPNVAYKYEINNPDPFDKWGKYDDFARKDD